MQYQLRKAHIEKMIAVIFFLLSPFISEAQSIKATATGTGLTTGHIATLSVTNTTQSTIIINPQTCFIPSNGTYQPYVVTIPSTSVAPGTNTILIRGYCANVYAQPVPAGNPMPPISELIAVNQPGINIPQGNTNVVTALSSTAFNAGDIPDLIKMQGYTPFDNMSSSVITTTWPNTDIPFNGTINPELNPKAFAPVLVEALQSISRAYDQLKSTGKINTPFSPESQKEREAIIQQTFWIYTAQITGKQYQKDQFREKVFAHFENKNNIEIKDHPKAELETLKRGIDVFWNTFTNLLIEANLLNGNKIEAGLWINTNGVSPPWNKIELTDYRMKPGYDHLKVDAHKFPWILAVPGALGAGTLIYFATKGDDVDVPIDTTDCTFSSTAIPTGSTCGLSNGSIQLNVNPPASYTYQWSNGATTQSLDNIPAGNYSVTISRTGTTCTQIVMTTVTNSNQNINATISSQLTDCDQPNGSVTVVTSPQGAYTYLWSNGATTQNLSNVPAGNYAVTISAGGTCQQMLSAQVGTTPFEPTVSFTTTSSNCGASDGSATISVTPQSQYTYAWSNGQSGSTISGLSAGSYQVTITKPGTTCTHVASVSVDDIDPSFSVALSSTMSGCGLSNGSASAVVTPPGSYDFIWSNGQSGTQISGLSAGIYRVTVSIPGTTCSREASIMITEASASFVVSLTGTQASCGLSDGTATATVNPPGNYTYTWSNGLSGLQVTGLAPGNYSVTVNIPGTNCSMQGNITITSATFPHDILLSTTPSACGGTDGTVTTTVTPPGELNYQWSNGQTGSQLTGVGAGTYTVTVTIPGTNCTRTASATVGELPASFTASVTSTPAGCGLSNGTATATVNPPGNYDYVWSNGQTGSQLTGVMAGAYTVTISIAGTACSQIANTTVEQLPPTFSMSFTSSPAGCGLMNGSAAVTVNPPGAYSYVWSNGSTGAQLSNVGYGTYTVTVTITGTSCSSSGSVNVGQTGGGFTATFTTDNATCGMTNGSATITVSPPGEYTYVWSNQQTGATATQLSPGTHSVTVTDNNDCVESFSVNVGEDPAEYINILSITPANCTGGGNVRFAVVTQGEGPLNIEVEGPGGITMITAASGSVLNLSTFITVVPGTYTFTVTDQQIGPMCSETVTATVPDITPPIELDSDFYFTQGTQPVSENALENDAGFNLQMTQIDNENGGSVTFMPNGNFIFIADAGFSGQASFVYTVTDGCGNIATAIVTIEVEELPCDIDVDFDITPASCGLEDGSITVIVSPPGDYEYEWDNGDSGLTIENLPPDAYSVTITDLDLGCTFEATTLLEGLPGDYVDDLVITQPTCDNDGDIEFTAISPGGNSLLMSVEGPGGNDEFVIEAGMIRLSDYVLTIPGEYTIEVSDPEAGLGCAETFTVTLNAPPLPEILVVEVFPPSNPGSMDGSAFIEVTVPGQFSYAVYHNGVFAFIINQNNFFLINLSAGVHTVYLVDINGCQSNTETFVVPPGSQPHFTLGIGVTNAASSSSNEQSSIDYAGNVWRSALIGTYHFEVGRIQQEVRVVYAPTININSGQRVNEFIAMEYLSGPDALQWKGINLKAQAGLGASIEKHDSAITSADVPLYWLLRASVERTICKRILISGSASLKGVNFIAPVSWEFVVRVPFYTWKK